MAENSLLLRFGIEEVIFLLQALKIKSLPGMGDDPTQGLTEDQLNRATAAGLNSLMARGLVTPPTSAEAPLTIESFVIAIFALCAGATRVVYVTHQKPDGTTDGLYVHTNQTMYVAHSLMTPTVHQFVMSETPEPALDEANSLLSLNGQRGAAAKGFSLTQAVFSQAGELLKNGKQGEAADLLKAQGASAETAGHLLDTLTGFKATSLVTLLNVGDDRPADAPPAQGFTLLEGANGLWRMTPDGDVLKLEPVTAGDVRKQIAGLLTGN